MSARDTADRLWRDVIRARDGRCRKCGSGGGRNHQGLPVVGLEAAHVLRRGYGHTRTDERNGVALCHLCHAGFTRDPDGWAEWITAELGEELLRTLRMKAKNTGHVDWDAEVARLLPIHTRLLAAA
jgi:hypothetical protein